MKSLNTKGLKDQLIKEEEVKASRKTGGGKDPRFLNYYDMSEGQQMTIRILPVNEDSSEVYVHWQEHGPNLKVRGAGKVNCAWTSSDGSESCPVCRYSFDLKDEGNKEEAKRWMRKDYFLAQCLVMESPIEINESDDGNPIKMMWLPFALKDLINDSVMNGTVSHPSLNDIVMKKTKNKGGFASYEKSHFKVQEDALSDDIIEALELYDLQAEVPAPTTEAEVQEWLDGAKVKVAEAANGPQRGSGAKQEGGATQEGSSTTTPTTTQEESAPTQPAGKKSGRDLASLLSKRKSAA